MGIKNLIQALKKIPDIKVQVETCFAGESCWCRIVRVVDSKEDRTLPYEVGDGSMNAEEATLWSLIINNKDQLIKVLEQNEV